MGWPTLVALVSFAAIRLVVSAGLQEIAEAPTGEQRPTIVLGALSCASSGCHGSPSPVTNGAIEQNEFTTWIENDKHAEAYEVLLSEDSRLIARNLNIEEAHEANVCLDCHSCGLRMARFPRGCRWGSRQGGDVRLQGPRAENRTLFELPLGQRE